MEFAVGTRGVSKDVTEGHEEREKSHSCSCLFLIARSKVSEESATRSLEHVVCYVKDPKSYDEESNSSWSSFLGKIIAQ
jgi:hypothetical protein